MNYQNNKNSEWDLFMKMDPHEKWRYFLDYYLIKTIVVVVVIAVVGSVIVSMALQKDTVLCGVMLNSDASSAQTAVEKVYSDLEDRLSLDPRKQQVELYTTLKYLSEFEASDSEDFYSLQVLAALTASEELNFIIGDTEAMVSLGYGEFFGDLTQILSKEKVELLEPYFLYVDGAVIEKMQDTELEEGETIEFEIPSSANKEMMDDPIPVFIDVSECEFLSQFYSTGTDQLLFAVAANTPDYEMIDEWLNYMME